MKKWIASLELRQRMLIVLIAIDHLALVIITLGNCARGETISASAWRQEQSGKLQGRIARPVIDWLFRVIEPDHCANSYLREKHMYQPPGGIL